MVEAVDPFNPAYVHICWTSYMYMVHGSFTAVFVYIDVRTDRPLLTNPDDTEYEVRIWEKRVEVDCYMGFWELEPMLLHEHEPDASVKHVAKFKLWLPSNTDFLCESGAVLYVKVLREYMVLDKEEASFKFCDLDLPKVHDFDMGRHKRWHCLYRAIECYNFKAPVRRDYYISSLKKLIQLYVNYKPQACECHAADNSHISRRLKTRSSAWRNPATH